MIKLLNRSTISLFILFFAFAGMAFAGDWEIRAELEVKKTGITEAVLIPELLFQISGDVYDLSLTGPDGNPRPFELYMKDKTGTKEISLQPLKIELTDSGGFIWESAVPDKLLTNIRVNIAERNSIFLEKNGSDFEHQKWFGFEWEN